MLARGYRVSKTRLGGHETTALYGVAALGSGPRAEHVENLDRMRRNRNRSEYGSWEAGAATVERDLEHARGIVEAVRQQL